MNKEEPQNSIPQSIVDWLPVALIFGGVALSLLRIDPQALTMNIGFFAYGTLGLIDPIKRKYYRQLSMKLLKVIGLIAIAVLAASTIAGQPGNFFILLMLILSDRIFLSSSRLESSKVITRD